MNEYGPVLRLVRLYTSATPEQLAEGQAWYPSMRRWCQRLATRHHVPLRNVVGAMAALSPVTPLDRNMKITVDLVEGRYVGHPYSDRARQILTSGDLSLLGARKTRAFAESILSAGRTDRVCFDSWAYRAMTGDMRPSRNGRMKHDDAAYKKWADNDRGYEAAVEIYQRAAAICGESPSNFQAVVWCAVRGTGT